MNFDRLRHIAERAEIGEHRESLLAVTIPERPGSLLRFCELIGNRSITEFNYRYSDEADAHIFVGVEISDPGADKQALIDALESDGYPVLDLTDNEMAKLHVRYMVGGTRPRELDEVLYRFDFPERPGALMHFLTRMGSRPWNISMFHYRNHGSAYGRVLIGLQVPQASAATSSRSSTRWGTSTGRRRRTRRTGCFCAEGGVPGSRCGIVRRSCIRKAALKHLSSCQSSTRMTGTSSSTTDAGRCAYRDIEHREVRVRSETARTRVMVGECRSGPPRDPLRLRFSGTHRRAEALHQ